MSTEKLTITQLGNAQDIRAHLPSLNAILQSCVNEGSSIGFLAPLHEAEAEAYWLSLIPAVQKETLHLFILTAHPSTSASTEVEILGTIQLSSIAKTTHSHRAEVQKLLVLPSARKGGLGRRLMEFLEAFAKSKGKEVLVLDTATESPAREMYGRLGWEEWGTCKGYASWADGSRCDATFFRKDL